MALITYQDKSAVNTNSGVADVNKVNASDMNEIKTVVNGNYTELAPTTLYDNSTGSKTSITLNDSVANYTYIEIFYGWEAKGFGILSTRYDISQSCNVNLSTTVLNNGYVYFATSEWTPTTTNINLSKGEYWRIGTSGNATRGQSNNISIYKVLGYKY